MVSFCLLAINTLCFARQTWNPDAFLQELAQADNQSVWFRKQRGDNGWLSLSKSGISDLSVLRDLPITYLDLDGCANVTDLTPLRGMALTGLSLEGCIGVTDLTPLVSMELTSLNIRGTSVTDVTALSGMKLERIIFSPERVTHGVEGLRTMGTLERFNSDILGWPESFWKMYDGEAATALREKGVPYHRAYVDTNQLWDLSFYETGIRDLSALKGMPVESLDLTGTPVDDLSALKGMPLEWIIAQGCSNIVDITPLAGAPLKSIHLDGTGVKDISPLRGMPLRTVMLERTKVTDLSPLMGMELFQLGISPRRVTNAIDVVAAMPTNGTVFIDHEFWSWWMSPSNFCDKVMHGDFIRPTIKPPDIPPREESVTADAVQERSIYTNVCASSSNGRYVLLQSKSLKTGKYSGCEIRYELVDRVANTKLWAQEVIHADGVFVENDGWVWLVSGDEHVSGFAPDGREYGQARIAWHSVFPPEHISISTRGSSWARSYSHSFFFNFDDRLYCCIAPWWQQYILIDLHAGKHVPATGVILNPIESELRTFAYNTLREAIGKREVFEQSKYGCDELDPVSSAVVIAGNRRISEAIPFLRQLEDVEFVDTEGIELRGRQYDFAVGDINPFVSQKMKFRALVQLALRRLGDAPACHPVYRFERKDESGNANWFDPPPLPELRAHRVHLVQPGMRVADVLNAVGTPDFMDDYPRPHWDYDIDAKEPYTLRIFWPSGPGEQAGKLVVTDTEKIKPPIWLESDQREMSIIR